MAHIDDIVEEATSGWELNVLDVNEVSLLELPVHVVLVSDEA
jgi:hypothetical protein